MTEKNKNKSIEFILEQGFVKPPTFWERISKMFNVFGWKFIFWDLTYSLIFVSITLLGTAFLFRHTPMDYENSIAFGFSPVLFLIIVLFAEMTERACGLYELKQTCRYTSRQITALRCIFYSVAGAAFAVIITAFSAENTAHFFRLLPLCLGGMFLCGAIELSVIRLSRSKWAIAVFSALWVFINLVLPFTFGVRWELFLSGLPIAITIIFAITGAAVLIYQINKMLTEENHYVIA